MQVNWNPFIISSDFYLSTISFNWYSIEIKVFYDSQSNWIHFSFLWVPVELYSTSIALLFQFDCSFKDPITRHSAIAHMNITPQQLFFYFTSVALSRPVRLHSIYHYFLSFPSDGFNFSNSTIIPILSVPRILLIWLPIELLLNIIPNQHWLLGVIIISSS